MTLKLHIHDVGHGHAVHAFTPNGQSIVVDLGCSDNFSPLAWLQEKTNTIDYLIITHPHGDHIDEILQLKDFKVRQMWRPKWLKESDVRNANQDNYSEKLDYYFDLSNNRFTHSIENDRCVGNPAVSGGVSITTHASRDCGVSNINNHSGVVIFEYCGVKVVIPGDNEPSSWKLLLDKKNFLEAVNGAHLFLASHHGRESGYHSDLFKAIKPKLCIVSDGRVQDTDATSRYSRHAEGWPVHNKVTGISNKRSCLTTRSDGSIEIDIGRNGAGRPFLSVATL